jgi:hypothetical protein
MTTPVRNIASITNVAARKIVEAGASAADASGQRSAIAVVDAAGHLLAFTRLDGAPVQAIQLSQDKAYTAAGFGLPTGQWHEFMSGDAPLALDHSLGCRRCTQRSSRAFRRRVSSNTGSSPHLLGLADPLEEALYQGFRRRTRV